MKSAVVLTSLALTLSLTDLPLLAESRDSAAPTTQTGAPATTSDQDASQVANQESTKTPELLRRLGQPAFCNGRRVRALRPLTADDSALLAAVSRGEFTVNGFRNRDLQGLFFSQAATTPTEARRRSAWVSRKLRPLRAHGLIRKVTGTHRYHVTASGRKVITAVLTALRSTVRQLTPIAA